MPFKFCGKMMVDIINGDNQIPIWKNNVGFLPHSLFKIHSRSVKQQSAKSKIIKTLKTLQKCLYNLRVGERF